MKSFARIHETNLKKQGMLASPSPTRPTTTRCRRTTIDFADLTEFAPEKPLTLVFKHADGSSDTIVTNHTYNAQQIAWFKAGSALNLIRRRSRRVRTASAPHRGRRVSA